MDGIGEVSDGVGLPADSYQPERVTSVKAHHWFAVYTQTRHERRVAEHLETRAVEHFLPLYRSRRQWKDREAKLDLPLFPNYLFVRIAREGRVWVLSTPGVVRIVSSGREPTPLRDFEIETLRAGIGQCQVEPYPHLAVGEQVRIKLGVMSGLEGVLVRRHNQDRVVVTLSGIRQSMAVEVRAEELEPLTTSRTQPGNVGAPSDRKTW